MDKILSQPHFLSQTVKNEIRRKPNVHELFFISDGMKWGFAWVLVAKIQLNLASRAAESPVTGYATGLHPLQPHPSNSKSTLVEVLLYLHPPPHNSTRTESAASRFNECCHSFTQIVGMRLKMLRCDKYSAWGHHQIFLYSQYTLHSSS